MHEHFLIDILNFASDSDETKQALIHWFWGNIERRRRIMFKQYFKDFPFTTLDEYALLNFISINNQITLTQASSYLYLERSTTSEMFKRFCSKSITKMDNDQVDGRIKYYSLTENGAQVVKDANEKMKEMNASLFQDLADNALFLEELKGVYQVLNERLKT